MERGARARPGRGLCGAVTGGSDMAAMIDAAGAERDQRQRASNARWLARQGIADGRAGGLGDPCAQLSAHLNGCTAKIIRIVERSEEQTEGEAGS